MPPSCLCLDVILKYKQWLFASSIVMLDLVNFGLGTSPRPACDATFLSSLFPLIIIRAVTATYSGRF